MTNLLETLGKTTRASFAKIGRGTFFLIHTLTGLRDMLPRPNLLVRQMYSVGVLSFLIIVISGLFVGMVLGLQGYYILSDFGAEESLGVMVAASLVRELGPV
ncbi:MAG: ABC transporter permease, partial [Methylomonas sp.]